MTMPDVVLPGFVSEVFEGKHGRVFVKVGGRGPPVLLLHGFPETHLMWRDIGPILARRYTVILADLPGYGQSVSNQSVAGAASKRGIAATLVAAMTWLGHDRFAIIGHDRGGRVAYRAALDHPQNVAHVAVLDVIPTLDVWQRIDDRLALAFWRFSLLAQPAPLPEALILGAPDAIIDNALSQWGSPPTVFPQWVREAYVEALSDPAQVHAICNEYRAAAGIDREHDGNDLMAGHRIDCPVLALWSASGGLASWYEDVGGPLALWQRWARDVRGAPVEGGHFFPEEHPDLVAALLSEFLDD